jgi:hypothetical protein
MHHILLRDNHTVEAPSSASRAKRSKYKFLARRFGYFASVEDEDVSPEVTGRRK